MMNSKLVLGIVLLSLLTLTGVVSADTVGRATVSGDVPPTLELTVAGGISNWQLQQPCSENHVIIDVTNIGNENGYNIMVADKMDPDLCKNPKPMGSAGQMTVYKDGSCDAGWGYATPTHKIENRLEFPNTYIELSGTDQVAERFTDPDTTHNFIIPLRQCIATDQKPASVYGGNGYRIIVTFTAVPN
jgi:hypothetical protein